MKRNQKGFTLVEMLCTVVILLLVSSMVTVGIRLAVDNYVTSITASESQELCTAILDGVSDELRYCSIKDWADTTSRKGPLFQSDRHAGDRSIAVDEKGQVVVKAENTGEDATLQDEALLPGKSYPNGMRAEITLNSDADRNLVRVEVKITDAKGKKLIQRTRDVEILNASQQS